MKNWGHYLEGSQHPIQIDMYGTQRPRSVYDNEILARWAEFLTDYDFVFLSIADTRIRWPTLTPTRLRRWCWTTLPLRYSQVCLRLYRPRDSCRPRRLDLLPECYRKRCKPLQQKFCWCPCQRSHRYGSTRWLSSTLVLERRTSTLPQIRLRPR